MKLNLKDCNKGINGCCCCNCVSFVEVKCHPKNIKIGKGSISLTMGFGCSLRFVNEPKKDVNVLVFSESPHGTCELHQKNGD